MTHIISEESIISGGWVRAVGGGRIVCVAIPTGSAATPLTSGELRGERVGTKGGGEREGGRGRREEGGREGEEGGREGRRGKVGRREEGEEEGRSG